jgi:glycosyltransferase involved in cell wall biosynthesis
LKTRLIVHPENRGWILEKFAVRLAEHLGAFGVDADISDAPSPSADLNHWLLYLYYDGWRETRTTALITHIDQFAKQRVLNRALETLDAGICLSRESVDTLARRGAPREKLCYATPAHDARVPPRRIVVGITSRAYGDGRKREWVLVELAKGMRLDRFHFEIIGDGWEPIIAELEAAGATVRHSRGTDDYARDYALTLQRIAAFDYYLYTGLDEGSMGFLDALAAGVPTIVTPQGFHLDVPGGITHAFTEPSELIAVFAALAAEPDRRAASVAAFSWARYAERHATLWRGLLDGRSAASALPGENQDGVAPLSQPRLRSLVDDLRFYSRPVVGRLKRLMK